MSAPRKLSDELVVELRELAEAGISDDELAQHYRVSRDYVIHLRSGRCRANAGGPITRHPLGAPTGSRRLEGEVARLRAELRELQGAVATLLGAVLRRAKP